MVALKVDKLNKKFGDFTAVNNLSFEVAENRVFGFLGPNGAGKTTTLRMLVGLSRPVSGTIEICGQPVNFENNQTTRLIGYLPEQPAFYTWMTGTEYLTFASNLFGLDEIDTKVKKVLRMVNLSNAKNKRIGTYSNGMKQRLGIAQALIHDPKLLIFDEPVSALDPIGRHEILEIINELKKDKTILLSTHILSDVDKICDDIAIINKGKLITVSPLNELKAKYSKPILIVEIGGNVEKVIDEIKDQKWLTRYERNVNELRLWVENQDVINQNIPLKELLQAGATITKYALTAPETEDLFINLVKNND